MASDVIAVFKQAAGVQAPQVLARLANFGVQGRATALDADLFSAPPPLPEPAAPAAAAAAPAVAAEPSAASSAGPLATAAAPPPSSTRFKPMFPRRPATGGPAAPPPPAQGDAEASVEVIEGDYEDVIDWEWPLRPPPKPEEQEPAPEEEPAKEAPNDATPDGEQAEGDAGAAEGAKAKAPTVKIHAASAVSTNTIELGLRFLDATVLYAVRPTYPARDTAATH